MLRHYCNEDVFLMQVHTEVQKQYHAVSVKASPACQILIPKVRLKSDMDMISMARHYFIQVYELYLSR